MLLFRFNQLKKQLSRRQIAKLVLLFLFFVFSFYIIFIAACIPQKAKIIANSLEMQSVNNKAFLDYDFPMPQKIAGYSVQFHYSETARVLDITFPHISSALCYQIMRSSLPMPAEILVNGKRVEAFSAQSCFQSLFVDVSFQLADSFTHDPLIDECVNDFDCEQGRCYHRFCMTDKILSE